MARWLTIAWSTCTACDRLATGLAVCSRLIAGVSVNMRRPTRIVSLTLVTAFLLVSAYVLWAEYAWRFGYEVRESVQKAKSSSAAARWWRCRNADRPMLLKLQQPWELEYSYSGDSGDFGPIAPVRFTWQAPVQPALAP